MIDKDSLDMLRNLYKAGTRIEAVSVAGHEAGTAGKVLEVTNDGVIVVIWDGRGQSGVRYPDESIRLAFCGGECMLGKKRGLKDRQCFDDCQVCGWNPSVAEERKQRIAHGGLVEGPGGIRRLIVRSHEAN